MRPVATTLTEKLAQLADMKIGDPAPSYLATPNAWVEELAKVAKEALDQIRRQSWQPIETAPIEPWTRDLPSFYRFKCLLQNEKGYVSEGWAYWVPPRRSIAPLMRWANNHGVCQPKYWMPLPQPMEG